MKDDRFCCYDEAFQNVSFEAYVKVDVKVEHGKAVNCLLEGTGVFYRYANWIRQKF